MSSFSRITDHGDDRGLCKGCEWWQAEHDGPAAEDATMGLCLQPELVRFSLEVSGHSGCNRFEPVGRRADESLMAGVAG